MGKREDRKRLRWNARNSPFVWEMSIPVSVTPCVTRNTCSAASFWYAHMMGKYAVVTSTSHSRWNSAMAAAPESRKEQ